MQWLSMGVADHFAVGREVIGTRGLLTRKTEMKAAMLYYRTQCVTVCRKILPTPGFVSRLRQNKITRLRLQDEIKTPAPAKKSDSDSINFFLPDSRTKLDSGSDSSPKWSTLPDSDSGVDQIRNTTHCK